MFRRIICLCLFIVTGVFVATPVASAQLRCGSAEREAPLNARKATIQGRNILYLSGEFVGAEWQGQAWRPSSAEVVRPDIEARYSYDELWICSGGGRVSEAIEIGQMLINQLAVVRIPSGSKCASACTIAYLGGIIRFVEDGADFEVHAASSVPSVSYYNDNSLLELECSTADPGKPCNQLYANLEATFGYNCDRPLAYEDCFYRIRDQSLGRFVIFIDLQRLSLRRQVPEGIAENLLITFALDASGVWIDLIEFYQLALNDGRTENDVRYAYMRARSELAANAPSDSQQVFPVGELTERLGSSRDADRLVYWQEELQKAELHEQRRVISYVKDNIDEFGNGALAAVRLFELMTTCHAANSCPLDQPTLRDYGYVNAID